jgi:homoserine kinase
MIGAASAPASSGNLGPGFDILALALSLRCQVTAEPSDTMTITENGSTKRLGDDDMIARAVTMAVDRPMHVTVDNQIPRARGLGSSSAVTAAAAGAAMKSMGDTSGPAKVFSIVTELEGHADNAAAAVFGGLVVATPDGIQKLALHESLQPVVGIPSTKLSTAEARAALPPEIDRPVVVRSLARLAFLLQGLQDGNADVLAHAIGDELHEIPRAELSPITQEMMVAAHHAGAVHVCWSGAGPSALALATPQNRGRVIGAMAGVLGTHGEVLALDVDDVGLS